MLRGNEEAAFVGEAELVERAQTGDPQAFELLVNRYMRLAGSVAYGVVGDYHAASDVVQDAFIKLHRSLPTLREVNKFKGWFLRMVKTTAIDHRRKQSRRPPIQLSQLAGIEEELPSTEQTPLNQLERDERKARILDAVSQLPEHYREVVTLKYLEGLSYEEIAEITGLSSSAVESKLFRARARLRKQLPMSPIG